MVEEQNQLCYRNCRQDKTLKYANLAQSDDISNMLNEIKSNDNLTTSHQNVIIKRDKYITVTERKEWKHLYTFKHPGTGT